MADPTRAATRPDRGLLLVLAISAAVLLARAVVISAAHSECYDDEYHLAHGAAFWRGGLARMAQPDPPLGQALTALPMVLTNRNPAWTGTLYDHSSPPETVLLLTALWRSLLFLPVIGIAFVWCRGLYGPVAGWLAAGLVLFEPTFAAHVPLAALDAIGVVGVVVGSYLAWRAVRRPTPARLAAAGAGLAFGMMLKHTAILLPWVAMAYAVLEWGVRDVIERVPWDRWRAALPARLGALGLMAAVGAFALWAMTLFDVSRPDQPPRWQAEPTLASRILDRPLPAGIYIGSIVRGRWHAAQGHPAYLFGERRRDGWWYYFPVVLAYKMPLGIAVVLVAAIVSLARARPRWEEWSLAVPAFLWTAVMLATRINIGLRHFLPAYVFLLLLAARAVVGARAAGGTGTAAASEGAATPAPGRAPRRAAIVAGLALAATAAESIAWLPDDLSYLNIPRARAYLDISDSNLDWGQGLKEIAAWLDRHPQPPERPPALLYFGDQNSARRVQHYLGDRVAPIWHPDPLPASGLVIASPVRVAGPFDRDDAYKSLRAMDPVDIIGRSLLVFDLDRSAQASKPR